MPAMPLKRSERGVALLIAVVLVLLVAVIGAAVSVVSRTETLISVNFRQSRELLYAAEGAVALAVRDLDAIPDWSTILSGGAVSSFTDGASTGAKTLPGGTTVVLCCGGGTLTGDVQGRAHAGRNWGADTPQWRIIAWGRSADWLPAGRIDSAVYVAVWAADDPADGDGNPAADANGFLELHAHALGVNGGRRVVQVLIQRPAGAGFPPPPGIRIVSWRDMRW